MLGINKVTILGTLGGNPEVKYLPNGGAIANISVATSEQWTGNDGQAQKRTEWHKIVFFKRLAEVVGQYLKKGSKVYIEGKLQTRKWQDQNGQNRYTTEIVANQMQMLDTKPQPTQQAQQPMQQVQQPMQQVQQPAQQMQQPTQQY